MFLKDPDRISIGPIKELFGREIEILAPERFRGPAPGERELAIKSQRAEDEHLLVSVSDTGVGLPAQQADHMFNAFFITKPHGNGMGLRISRSIIESHGPRLILHATPGFTSCCQ